MKKYFLSSLAIIFISTLSVFAQETPKTEYSIGYAYLRAADQNYDGFDASMTYNLNKSVGLVSDFAGLYSRNGIFAKLAPDTPAGQTISRSSAPDSIYTFMVGPRFSFNKNGRFTPFAETLVGLDRINERFKTVMTSPTGNLVLNNNGSSFVSVASKIGGGLDFNAGRHVTIRALEADYLFLNNVKDAAGFSGQNGMRVTCGLNVRF